MRYSLAIQIPEAEQKIIGIGEDTPLEAFFEDGTLHVQECDDAEEITAENADYAQGGSHIQCQGCEHYCRLRDACLKDVQFMQVSKEVF